MNQQILIGIGVGLVIGGTAGYFFGSSQAIQSINNQLVEQNAANEKAASNFSQEVQTNPLKDVKTNPYENVKTNPFE